MRRALPAIVVTAAGITWLLRTQGVIDSQPLAASGSVGTTPDASSTHTPSTTPSTVPTTTAREQRAVDGKVADTRWGPVQVEAVIRGSRLVDVKVLIYPNERDRSVYINEQALPILHDEAIRAQSAHLDGLSGATYTWDGYARSLQSALDAARFSG